MRNSLRAAKFALWVVFISSTVALVFAFGLNSIFASPPPAEPETPAGAAGKPRITVQPENGRLIATAANFNATDWQSVGPNQSANCNSTLFETSASGAVGGNEVVLEPADYGRYYCFQALGDMGERVRQSHYVADSGSAIGISRSLDEEGRTVLAASYHRTVLGWQHAGPLPSAEACSADAFAGAAEEGSSLTVELPADDTAAYYCFRAETRPGGWIYKPYLLQGEASVASQT